MPELLQLIMIPYLATLKGATGFLFGVSFTHNGATLSNRHHERP